jgi:hypothetical protein
MPACCWVFILVIIIIVTCEHSGVVLAHSVPGYGRPRSGRNTTWLRCAYQDVQELGMAGTLWFDTTQDRQSWAEKIEILCMFDHAAAPWL